MRTGVGKYVGKVAEKLSSFGKLKKTNQKRRSDRFRPGIFIYLFILYNSDTGCIKMTVSTFQH